MRWDGVNVDYYIPPLPCPQLAGGSLYVAWAAGLHKRGLPLTWMSVAGWVLANKL